MTGLSGNGVGVVPTPPGENPVPRRLDTRPLPRQLVTSHQVEEKTPPSKPGGEKGTARAAAEWGGRRGGESRSPSLPRGEGLRGGNRRELSLSPDVCRHDMTAGERQVFGAEAERPGFVVHVGCPTRYAEDSGGWAHRPKTKMA